MINDLLWYEDTPLEDKHPAHDISMLAYPGLSPIKMRILGEYVKCYYNETNQLTMKDQDPPTWICLWKLIHAKIDDWTFLICFAIYFYEKSAGGDYLIPSGIDLLSILGDKVTQLNSLMLLTIGEGLVDKINNCKNPPAFEDNSAWVNLDREVRKTCLKLANNEFQEPCERLFQRSFSKPPRNLYSSADRYGNYMNKRRHLIRWCNGDTQCSAEDFMDNVGIWRERLFSSAVLDEDFGSNGEYK